MNAQSQIAARAIGPAFVPADSSPLHSFYDGLLLDLDGTLIRGTIAIPGAPEALSALDLPVSYVTNNASKSPGDVAKLLSSLGFSATSDQVMTSSQAAVAIAKDSLAEGTKALVVGAPAFTDLVREAGFQVVTSADDGPEVVFQGLSKELTWADLAEGALAIRAGARWIASNTDTTLPTERGLLPGNGAFVKAMEVTTDKQPEVAGKPGAEILIRAAQGIGSKRPLVIGDRLDTDIAGACAAQMDSLMVLTGVSTEDEALRSDAGSRPTFVAPGLESLTLSVSEYKGEVDS